MYNGSVSDHPRSATEAPARGSRTPDVGKRPLSALIIGIDKYQSNSIVDLDGAVSDARNIGNFFDTHPGLPFSKPDIKYLIDKDATRKNILDALTALRLKSSIHHGDPIVIYFAGHGSSGPANELEFAKGDTKKVIEFIVPYDCDEYTAGIPDWTIGRLLSLLAHEKGDNITVILDCCHSASATRSLKGLRSRHTALPTRDIPSNLDLELSNEFPNSIHARDATAMPHSFVPAAFASHILLAACGINEDANEANGHGVFTSALLQTLKQVIGEHLSYRQLMTRLPDLKGQNPQCQGLPTKIDRRLFSTETAPIVELVRALGGESTVIVRSLSDKQGFEARPSDVPNTIRGELLTTKEAPPIRIYIDLEKGLESIVGPLRKKFETDGFRINVPTFTEPKPGDAQLKVSMDKKVAVFDDLTIFSTGLASPTLAFGTEEFKRLPFTTQPDFDHLSPILFAAIHWYYHLLRKPASHALTDAGRISVEFTELKPVLDDMEMLDRLEPSPSNLISTTSGGQGLIEILVDPGKLYGQKIKNESDHNIYPHLFYFSNSDFSITSDYLPSIPTTNGTPDPLLPKRNSVSIGYGEGGADPYSYELLEGQNVDRGFYKLFLTTKYVDLSCITQDSPFERRAGRAPVVVRDWREKFQKPAWDEITLTIMQHRS